MKGTPWSWQTRRARRADVEQRAGVEVLLAQLHEVDAALDARGEEAFEVGAVGRAEVEPPRRRGRSRALPAGDGPDQLEPVAVDQPGGGGVAPVHGLAVALDQHPAPAQAELREQVVDRGALGQLDGVAVRRHLHALRTYPLTLVLPMADTRGVSPPDHVVELEHVSRRFGTAVGLADLTLRVPPGSVTVLLGPNGAGKTTAVRTITGALDCDTGHVRVFGHDPAAEGEAVRERCGVVSAKPALYDRLSGRDNLRYAAELQPAGRPARRSTRARPASASSTRSTSASAATRRA